VGVIGSFFGPHAPVLVAAALVVLGVGSFAVHPTHAAPLRRHRSGVGVGVAVGAGARAGARERATDRALVLRAALVPTAAMLLIGIFFIAVQNALNVFAATTAYPSCGGLLYSLLAVGSSVMALAMTAVPAQVSARARCVSAGALMLTGVAAMAISDTLGGLVLALLFAGLGIGPLLVTLHTVAGRRAPAGHGATVMALLGSGTVVGVAIGALVAGPLAQAHGAGGAFAVAGAAAVLLVSLTAAAVRD
jgi:MFS family permease